MKRWLALALLVALPVAAQDRFPRCRSAQGRSDRGFSCDPGLAFFEFAPASGAGLGAPCACAAVTGAKGEAVTFARASAAECYSNNGQTLTQCGAGLPRISSGTAASTWAGLWVEPTAAINLITQGRDLSQAVWTKTSMTCALIATGMRGDANAASTCTATGANATVCQTVAAAAATRTSSWHVKRVTGTGAVTLARDAATYSADISASLSSTLWRRTVPADTPGCAGGNCIVVSGATSSVLNPQVCLKLATSGDAVAIDFVQDEAGGVASTPIFTAAASATRAAESAQASHTALSVGSMSVIFQSTSAAVTTPYYPLMDFLDGSNAVYLYSGTNGSDLAMNCASNLGGANALSSPTFFTPYAATTGISLGCVFGPGVQGMVFRGGPTNGIAAGNTPALTSTTLIGAYSGIGPGGVFKGIKVDSSRTAGLWNPGQSVGGKAIAWVGDSITFGLNSTTARPPAVLAASLSQYVQGFGISGDVASGCLLNWRNNVSGKGYATVIVECGVNDLAAGTAAAAIYPTLQTIYNEAQAQGMRVIASQVLPWGLAAAWTAGKQTETTALNASISGTSFSNGAAVNVSTLATGNNLSAGFDSGDGLHPNAAGSTAWAALIQAANP